MDKTQEETLNELYKFRMDLTNKLNLVNKEIERLEKEKIKNCKHEYVTYREDCMYGEKTTCCKYCGVDRVW